MNEKECYILEVLVDVECNNVIGKQKYVSRQRYYEINRVVIIKMA
jgi:hypothetical protein